MQLNNNTDENNDGSYPRAIQFFNSRNETFQLIPGQRIFSRDVFQAIEKDCLEAQRYIDPPITNFEEEISKRKSQRTTKCPILLESPAGISRHAADKYENSDEVFNELFDEWKSSNSGGISPDEFLAIQAHR